MTVLAPVRHLEGVSRDYPGIWRSYGDMLSRRGVDLPEWPSWCYCPLAAAFALASSVSDPLSAARDTGRVGALAAWRPTQGVYRFGEELLDSLWNTPIVGNLPVEHLHRLPAWCVYVETPGKGPRGFFAHLEWDANTGKAELRLLLDDDKELTPIPIHLGDDLSAGLEAFLADAAKQSGQAFSGASSVVKRLRDFAAPMISTLLYLCSGEAETVPTRGQRKPVRELKAKRTRDGEYIAEAADKPEVYHTGFKLSQLLREAADSPGDGGSVRGHVRRAHWHSYWLGSGESKRLELRWLHPILVGVGPDRPTVHHAKG